MPYNHHTNNALFVSITRPTQLLFDSSDCSRTYYELTRVHLSLLDGVSRLDPSTFLESEREQMQIYTHMLQTFVPVTEAEVTEKDAFAGKEQVDSGDMDPSDESNNTGSVSSGSGGGGYLLRSASHNGQKGSTSNLQRCVVDALAAALRSQTSTTQFQVSGLLMALVYYSEVFSLSHNACSSNEIAEYRYYIHTQTPITNNHNIPYQYYHNRWWTSSRRSGARCRWTQW